MKKRNFSYFAQRCTFNLIGGGVQLRIVLLQEPAIVRAGKLGVQVEVKFPWIKWKITTDTGVPVTREGGCWVL